MSEGNGRQRRYRVSISGAVAKQIKDEARIAAESGQQSEFTHALLIVNHRLRTEPLEFGELTNDKAGLIYHTGTVVPISVIFAIDQKNMVVYIKKVILSSV